MSWNRGAGERFGYTADEAVGQSITIVIPLDRVAEEVSQRDLQEPAIAESDKLRLNRELHRPFRLGIPQPCGNIIRQRREVNLIQLHFTPVHARELQHVVNQALQYIFRKDKDFIEWLNVHGKPDLLRKAIAETTEDSGKRKGGAAVASSVAVIRGDKS